MYICNRYFTNLSDSVNGQQYKNRMTFICLHSHCNDVVYNVTLIVDRHGGLVVKLLSRMLETEFDSLLR